MMTLEQEVTIQYVLEDLKEKGYDYTDILEHLEHLLLEVFEDQEDQE